MIDPLDIRLDYGYIPLSLAEANIRTLLQLQRCGAYYIADSNTDNALESYDVYVMTADRKIVKHTLCLDYDQNRFILKANNDEFYGDTFDNIKKQIELDSTQVAPIGEPSAQHALDALTAIDTYLNDPQTSPSPYFDTCVELYSNLLDGNTSLSQKMATILSNLIEQVVIARNDGSLFSDAVNAKNPIATPAPVAATTIIRQPLSSQKNPTRGAQTQQQQISGRQKLTAKRKLEGALKTYGIEFIAVNIVNNGIKILVDQSIGPELGDFLLHCYSIGQMKDNNKAKVGYLYPEAKRREFLIPNKFISNISNSS